MRCPRSAAGTVKQMECSDDACVMSETDTPSRCRAVNVRPAMPGTPSMPLPVTVTSACAVTADSALTGYFVRRTARRDLRTRGARIGEGPNEQRRRRARERRERTRVKHLRAVVRELGCLTSVELWDHPRVADDAWVGREQPRNILP